MPHHLKLVRSAPKPLAGLYTSGRLRKQAVSTPGWFLDTVREGMRLQVIPLDPCARREVRLQFAAENWTRGGLRRAWHAPAYCNPPYVNLVEWLAYAQSEAQRTGYPTVFLGPWRSHRIGFCNALKGAMVHFFKAFPFAGHKNSPPFPVFAAAWHVTLPRSPYEMDRKQW